MPIKINLHKNHKSLKPGIEFTLPDFCLITGKNGSGKTHLLEAMADGSLSTITDDGRRLTNIAIIPFNGLAPDISVRCAPQNLVSIANTAWEDLREIIQRYKNLNKEHSSTEEILRHYVSAEHGDNPQRSKLIRNITECTGKKFIDISEEDVHEHVSFATRQNRSLFFSQIAVAFQAYHRRMHQNLIREFQNHKGHDVNFLSDDDFINRYGPPPWDILNEILRKTNLPYEFKKPHSDNLDIAFDLHLIDIMTKEEMSPSCLSTGEQVLMSLALAMYNTREDGNKPDLLLLDEPDAALHPQFSSLLLDIVVETIVKNANIKVVMTTHSPTTVAQAPLNSVYEMDRTTKTPEMVSNNAAIKVLTQGLDFLRIGYENRRQIFVESIHDVKYYEKLFYILKRTINFGYQPFFMNPHREKNTNCSDVITIIDQLSESGCDTAWGIIDYDRKNTAQGRILVLGSGERYAIENYLLDPIYVALALIQQKTHSFTDFNIHSKTRYPEASELTNDECQTIIEEFLKKIGIPLQNTKPTTLRNGFTVYYPEAFLEHQGHDYENLLTSKIVKLKALSRGQGEAALKLAILETIEDFPQFLPREIVDLFTAIN
ncbi:putative AbiEii toxin of type IV toxin-antitoxin system [Pseudomonas putida]|uniref:ATP-binding protein n=1 Tax=Pseudomonas putida TaxID=303 RepID=UPI00104CAE2E|nr:ATP-binding protein [Pseudomonas putida]TCP73446.1 putative AbiEii toxin of type IV toxin-antitoxin system [Pseudomonas putida]